MPGDKADLVARLEAGERDGLAPEEAAALFADLDGISVAEVLGRWRGGGLHTGHAFDGLLEAAGWWGKAFETPGDVHPLLFGRSPGAPVALDPRRMPLGLLPLTPAALRPGAARLFGRLVPLIGGAAPAARLVTVVDGGVRTAAMVYDHRPIIDVFRQAAPGVILGRMDMRGEAPFWFTLRRAD